MISAKYALAVEIDKDVFEIFDIIYFDKDSNQDKRYSLATKNFTKGFRLLDNKNIKIGSEYKDGRLIPKDSGDLLEFDDSGSVFAFFSENKLFGLVYKNADSYDLEKYNAAFDSNVTILNISSENNIGLGDTWDTKEFKRI